MCECLLGESINQLLWKFSEQWVEIGIQMDLLILGITNAGREQNEEMDRDDELDNTHTS